ncbi:hypothetical protein TBLA_0I03230 [Henningerozyma blattae CBS 6284]|uniref:CDP-diacylglycerol--serine O-phosphatidyltransferase n=1 Tax=Henningerozyma blattae (strain ATCC 34711 / CBS 6284 / DSM 70876 / NBRC 10599 / NRRL Y-10934 / UCD 77-7) TaxID=1071380 RepID=I2H9C6_HENB6|nr:hypothetical protein TBLA_0I03230 [Tetrapisispora blattae CBS 6284]CCH62978.1 hypothetical protein TBLA_0I03230 [Tetrapisispora blattae CBS 6284]
MPIHENLEDQLCKSSDSMILSASTASNDILTTSMSNNYLNTSASNSNDLASSDLLELGISQLNTSQYYEVRKFINDERPFSLVRNLKLADYVTLLNAILGFFPIIYSIKFSVADEPRFIYVSYSCITIGLLCDFLDGRIARWNSQSSLVGQEMDSLADLISFAIAPSTIAFAVGFQTNVDMLCLSFFIACVLARLARFNVSVNYLPKDISGKSKYFEGLPAPTSVLLVLFMYFLTLRSKTMAFLPLGVAFDSYIFEFHPLVLVFVITGCGMVSKRLKIPKL